MMPLLDLEAEGTLSTCRKHTFAILAFVVLLFTTYSNTFHASWHLDDYLNILENPNLHLTTLSWVELKEALVSSPPGLKSGAKFPRPVSRLSLALNYYLGGQDVVGYHLVNLGIHLATTIFLYLFIFHALRIPTLRARYGPNAYSLALLAAVFWGIHPIQTQAVTYVVQRMACLSAMFYIMAMTFFLRGYEAQTGCSKWVFFSLTALCGLLSFGSKENAIMLPLSIFLVDLLLIRGVSKANLARSLRLFLLLFVMPASLGLILLFSAGLDIFGFLALYDMRPFGPWERLLTELRVVVMYLSLLLYPVSHRFSIDHPITVSESLLTPPATLLSALLLLAILAGAVSLAKRYPLISFAVIFFFLNHLVESTILPIELVFEHRNYLPSMFLFLPVAVGVLRSLAYFSRRPPMQGFIAAFVTLVIIGLGHATYIRNFAWKNEESLWLSCLEDHPNSFRAHHNLGRVYQRRGQREMARSAYRRALKCENLHSKGEKGITYFNLGFLAYEANQMDKAKAFYLKALETDPCCPGAHNNLAGLLSETGAPAEKILEELMMAVECNQPIEVPLALSNLGVLLVKEGRADEAVSALQRSLRLDPQNELTLLRLGQVYRLDGRLGAASGYFMRVLKRNPRNVEALLGLAELHVSRGAPSKAYEVITRIVDTLRPEEFSAFIAGMRKEDHLLRISSDVESLFGLLYKAYDRRALQFKENAEHARGLDQQVRTTP